MKLLVDVGNTSIKLGWAREGEIIYSRRLHTNPSYPPDELWSQWEMVMDESLERAEWIVGSVVPELTETIRDATESHSVSRVRYFEYPWKKLPLEIDLDSPASVGADRLAGAVAFSNEWNSGAVVDFGTATTVDVIDRNLRYRGGIILPGIEAGNRGLARETALLPRIPPRPPGEFSFGSTHEGLRTGLFYGMAGAVTRVLSELKSSEMMENFSVVATGGAGTPFVDLCSDIEAYDANLVLKGLLQWSKRIS